MSFASTVSAATSRTHVPRRVSPEDLGSAFDVYDVTGTGELNVAACVDVATIFFHFLDRAPSAIFAPLLDATRSSAALLASAPSLPPSPAVSPAAAAAIAAAHRRAQEAGRAVTAGVRGAPAPLSNTSFGADTIRSLIPGSATSSAQTTMVARADFIALVLAAVPAAGTHAEAAALYRAFTSGQQPGNETMVDLLMHRDAAVAYESAAINAASPTGALGASGSAVFAPPGSTARRLPGTVVGPGAAAAGPGGVGAVAFAAMSEPGAVDPLLVSMGGRVLQQHSSLVGAAAAYTRARDVQAAARTLRKLEVEAAAAAEAAIVPSSSSSRTPGQTPQPSPRASALNHPLGSTPSLGAGDLSFNYPSVALASPSSPSRRVGTSFGAGSVAPTSPMAGAAKHIGSRFMTAADFEALCDVARVQRRSAPVAA
jgi:hypothetical protein